MQTDRWDIGGVLTVSWDLFKQNALPLLGSALVFALLWLATLLIPVVCRWGASSSDSTAIELVASLLTFGLCVVLWAGNAFFTVGFSRMLLKAVRNETPTMGDLFGQLAYFLPGLAASVLIALGVAVATPFCILPGVGLFVGWLFTMLLIVDRWLGPIEAMRESWRLTEGERVDLLLWLLTCLGLIVAGILLCCVGVFIALPLCGLGTTVIYNNLTERKAL